MRRLFLLVLGVCLSFFVWAQVSKPSATIKKATVAPVIDGNIDAVWSTANVYPINRPFRGETPTLGAVGSTTWSGLWTNEGIYILLNVNDNVWLPGFVMGQTDWMSDHPELYFDVNKVLLDGGAPGSVLNNAGHYQVAPGILFPDIHGTPKTDIRGVVVAYNVTDPAYKVEYFIPFTLLKDKDGAAFDDTRTIGFDVTIIDLDTPTGVRQRMCWANAGSVNESWSNMDDCGTITLSSAIDNTIKTINVTAGGLATALTPTELTNITNLTLTGTIDARDFKTMRDRMPLLAAIDLSNTTITAYTGTEGTGSYLSGTAYLANQIPGTAFFDWQNNKGKTSLNSIVFPTTLTSIDYMAFTSCSSLKAVNFPPALLSIYNAAFSQCINLSDIYIPSTIRNIWPKAFIGCNGPFNVDINNLYYSSIDGILFSKNKTTLLQCPINLKSYDIPSSVNLIENSSFYNCIYLTSVTIPASVTSIGENAFWNCSGLNTIYSLSIKPVILKSSYHFTGMNKSTCKLFVPVGSKQLYQTALYWKDFTNIVEIPDFSLSTNEIVFKSTQDKTTVQLTTNGIGWKASSDAAWLTVSPTTNDNSVPLVIEASANTSSLQRHGKITVSAPGVESKVINVFQAAKEIVTEMTIYVDVPGTLSSLLTAEQKKNITRLTVTGTIDARDFKTMRDDLPNLEFLDLGGVNIAAYTGNEGTAGTDVISYPANAIPDYAFCKPDILVGKSTLASFTFPKNVTTIKNSAFSGCIRLSAVNFPSSVTTIERNTFYGCTGLTGTLTIPSSVTFIGSDAFNLCFNISVVSVSASVQIIEVSAFDYHTLINVDAGNPYYSSIAGVFFDKAQTTLIQSPKILIGSYTVPLTVITIGPGAFTDCTELTDLSVPASVQTISTEAFKGCTKLKGIILPRSLTSIGFRAFMNCSGLKTFNIPGSVSSIGSEAFRGCAGLESIYANSVVPIDLSNSLNVFDGINKTNCKLYVPFGSKSDYQKADQWKDFFNIIEMPGLKLSANTADLEAPQGSCATIELSSNTSWMVNSQANWIKVNQTIGDGNRTLTFTVDVNATSAVRTGIVYVYISGNAAPCQTITITQKKNQELSISTINQSKILGTPVEVPVITSYLIAADGYISYQFTLDYDQTKLEYVDKKLDQTIAIDGSVVVNSATPGHLLVSYMRLASLSGEGNILKLKFNTLETGTSPITISNFLYNTKPVTAITNGVITINENIPPTATITYSDLDALVKPGDILSIKATFSEPMADIPVPQIVLSGTNTLPASNMVKVSDTEYSYTYTVADGNGIVSVMMVSGTDLVGNDIVTTPTSGGSFKIDNVLPTVKLSFSDADLKVRVGDEISITATFSEAILESVIPKIQLSGANVLDATAMTKVNSTVYTFNHFVENGNGTVTVLISAASDIAGNPLVLPIINNSFVVIPTIYGDIDDNGRVQAYDAALALQHSVGLDPLPSVDPLPWEPWRIIAADVDGSKSITAYDAALILQYSANIISRFPVEGTLKNALFEDADVKVAFENGYLVFRSVGNLLGLNVEVNQNNQYLGKPQITNSNMILATNISDSKYAIGLATTTAPENDDIFMKIPVTGLKDVTIILDMIVNQTAKQVSIGLMTGIDKISAPIITIYPNPTTNTLYIKGMSEYSKTSICDLNGKTIIENQIDVNQIDVSKLQRGLYLLKIETESGVEIRKFEKR